MLVYEQSSGMFLLHCTNGSTSMCSVGVRQTTWNQGGSLPFLIASSPAQKAGTLSGEKEHKCEDLNSVHKTCQDTGKFISNWKGCEGCHSQTEITFLPLIFPPIQVNSPAVHGPCATFPVEGISENPGWYKATLAVRISLAQELLEANA